MATTTFLLPNKEGSIYGGDLGCLGRGCRRCCPWEIGVWALSIRALLPRSGASTSGSYIGLFGSQVPRMKSESLAGSGERFSCDVDVQRQ